MPAQSGHLLSLILTFKNYKSHKITPLESSRDAPLTPTLSTCIRKPKTTSAKPSQVTRFTTQTKGTATNPPSKRPNPTNQLSQEDERNNISKLELQDYQH